MAIVVPDEEVLVRWAANNGIDGTFFELCERQVQCICTCACVYIQDGMGGREGGREGGGYGALLV